MLHIGHHNIVFKVNNIIIKLYTPIVSDAEL